MDIGIFNSGVRGESVIFIRSDYSNNFILYALSSPKNGGQYGITQIVEIRDFFKSGV